MRDATPSPPKIYAHFDAFAHNRLTHTYAHNFLLARHFVTKQENIDPLPFFEICPNKAQFKASTFHIHVCGANGNQSMPSPLRSATSTPTLQPVQSVEHLPPVVIAAGAPSSVTRLPPRPPGQKSPASRAKDIFQGTGLTIAEADRIVLPHVLHHMADSRNDNAISRNGFDHSKAKKDPENRFAFDPSGASPADLERHISRSRSVYFGLGESDRVYMQNVKREDKELHGVDTSIHHAMIPNNFPYKLVQDESNPPERNYHRIEGSVPATCNVAEPVESRPLALQAVSEKLENAGYKNISQIHLNKYMTYMTEKFKDEENFEPIGK